MRKIICRKGEREGMIGQIMVPVTVAAVTSFICCKISAAHTFNVIDGYVKEMIELEKKLIVQNGYPQKENGMEKPYSITKQYADSLITCSDADNGLVQAELSVVLKAFDWYKFQSQPFYQQLIEYLDNAKTQ